MSGLTPVFQLPYLTDLDPAADIGVVSQRLAERIDSVMTGRAVDPQLSTLQQEIAARSTADTALGNRVGVLEAAAALGIPVASMRGAGSYSLPNSAWTGLPMTASDLVDTLNGHDPLGANPSRWICPAGEGGWYLAGGAAQFISNATGRRFVGVHKNGVDNPPANNMLPSVTATAVTLGAPTSLHLLAPGDYLELQAFQDSGAALAMTIANCGWWLARLIKT